MKAELKPEYLILLVFVLYLISRPEILEGRDVKDLIGASFFLVLLFTFILSQLGGKWK